VYVPGFKYRCVVATTEEQGPPIELHTLFDTVIFPEELSPKSITKSEPNGREDEAWAEKVTVSGAAPFRGCAKNQPGVIAPPHPQS
jgi:hypothetical protein